MSIECTTGRYNLNLKIKIYFRPQIFSPVFFLQIYGRANLCTTASGVISKCSYYRDGV